MPSLVPERRMGLPAKCTFCGVPVSPEMVGSLTGGTISGETRRKGANNISYLVAHKPVGKEGVQYSHVRGRETGFARVTPSLQCDDSSSQPCAGAKQSTGERG